MGSVFKRVKKTIKKVTKPISKVTKGIAKGIAKVAKSVMKGVAKLNKKLGPIGMIAMSIAMPYAMQGLGTGFANLSTKFAGSPFGNFLKAVGEVGSNMKTGWTKFKTGFGNMLKDNPITNSIRNTFSRIGNGDNIFTRISDGAKRMYTKARELTPKFRTGKEGTVTYQASVPGGGTAPMTIDASQAAKALESGAIDVSQITKQTLGGKEGFFTKAGSTKSDSIITDIINESYKDKIKMLDVNGTRHFNDLVNVSKQAGTYANDAEIFNYMLDNNGTTAQYFTDFSVRPDAYVTDLAKTGDYKFIKGGMNVPNPNVESGLSMSDDMYKFNGNKTFDGSLEPSKFSKAKEKLTSDKVKKAAIGEVKSFLAKKEDIIQPPEFEAISTSNATSNTNSGAVLTSAMVQGSTGTDFFKKTYGDEAWQKLKESVNNMHYQGNYDYA
tara:strand:- start:6 stop:1322 length:1317 start_codon:yes stop_codon:yes gene_type:complete